MVNFKLRFVFCLLIGFWALVGGTIFLSTMPMNPLNGLDVDKKILFTFFPQGWAFFTRNAKEDKYFVYQKVGGRWENQTHPNTSYFLGAGRDMRLQGLEMDMLLSQVDLKGMAECASIDSCNFKSFRAVNYINHPQLCGEILILFQEPVPWAWAYHGKNINMPVKGVIINVKCNGANHQPSDQN